MKKSYEMNFLEFIVFIIASLFIVPYGFYCLWKQGGYDKYLEKRENAENNDCSLTKPLWDLVHECQTQAEKEYMEYKIGIISNYFYWRLHSGNTPDAHYSREENMKVYDFFKRNNIDMYSEDFDPEYVAKCVRDWKI